MNSKDLPVEYLDNNWRIAARDKCTKKKSPVLPDLPRALVGKGADRNKSIYNKEQMQAIIHYENNDDDHDYDSDREGLHVMISE